MTLGDLLTPAKKNDFILLLETASQRLRLPSQHFVLRRSPPLSTLSPESLRSTHTHTKKKPPKQNKEKHERVSSKKGELRKEIPIHEWSARKARWS